MATLVSVIIPAYNSAVFLAETLESALGQSYRNCEIIVVNDGSTDNTECVLSPYLNRVVYHKQENKGLPAALNVGLKLSQGQYITILDADDLWDKDKIQAQLDLMETFKDVGLCYTNFIPFGEPVGFATGFDENNGNLRRYKSISVGSDAYVLTSPSLLLELLRVQGMPKPSSVMFRRSCFEKVGNFNEQLTFCQDTQMTLRMAKYFGFGYIDRGLLKRRIHARSLASIQSDRAYVAEHIQMFETLGEFIPLSPVELSVCQQVLSRYYAAAGYIEFSNKQLGLSRAFFLKSFRLKPSYKALRYLVLSVLPMTALEVAQDVKRSVGSLRQ